MAYLRHRWNGNTMTLYEVSGQVVIGRHMDCNIPIDDPTVSAQHAQLSVSEQGCILTDLNSTNGVRVEGKNIRSIELQDKMSFFIGTHEFEYLIEVPNDLDKTLKIKKSWIPGVYFTE